MALEYDVRFGDPETQTILSLLSSETDLAEILIACTNDSLCDCDLTMLQGYSVTVVAVAQGYPQSSELGLKVEIGRMPHG
jgi:phosphoribosylamine--glycine ligase / phosphoribosylformylglycinamidine cyclo-ligase